MSVKKVQDEMNGFVYLLQLVAEGIISGDEGVVYVLKFTY